MAEDTLVSNVTSLQSQDHRLAPVIGKVQITHTQITVPDHNLKSLARKNFVLPDYLLYPPTRRCYFTSPPPALSSPDPSRSPNPFLLIYLPPPPLFTILYIYIYKLNVQT